MMLKLMTALPPQPPSQSPANLRSASSSSPSRLPVRTIPGSHGWPLVGPLRDRLDYFWFQGPETFFKTRIEKHNSTVFRTNVPPTFPFLGNVNPNVVAVLDVKSFSHMFDMEIVEKRDILIGDFKPSLKFTGDIRVCVYLDPSEPKHEKVKGFAMEILKRSSSSWTRDLLKNLTKLCDEIDADVSKDGSASFFIPLQRCVFNFMSSALIGIDAAAVAPEIASNGFAMLDKWLALQILPTVKIGILQPLEEIFLHSFAYPFALVAGDYNKLYEFIGKHGDEVLKLGEDGFGLTREETIHNLLFVLGFNAYGGFSVFLPSLLGTVLSDESLQEKIKAEVRSVIASGSVTDLSFRSVNDMKLVNSIVYEALRMNPPVPLQFARARKDFKLESPDSVFDVKKGELLCGYQPLVMRDPNIFKEPDTFKPDRFMGETGSELLNYLYWSNGPQTGSATESNKQCAAKDYVPLTASLILAYLFLRYDKISGDSGKITAVKKASI